jgi:hypothetical protein
VSRRWQWFRTVAGLNGVRYQIVTPSRLGWGRRCGDGIVTLSATHIILLFSSAWLPCNFFRLSSHGWHDDIH